MKRKGLMPTTYFFIAIVVMVALHFLYPIKKLIPLPCNYAGIALIVIGIWVNIWCSNLFNKVKTAIKPFEQSTHLATEGAYRFSRHPMYLGMAAVLVGIALSLGTVMPMLVIPVFIWVMEKKFIGIEEKALEETFGDAYREYKKRVRRWI